MRDQRQVGLARRRCALRERGKSGFIDVGRRGEHGGRLHLLDRARRARPIRLSTTGNRLGLVKPPQ